MDVSTIEESKELDSQQKHPPETERPLHKRRIWPWLVLLIILISAAYLIRRQVAQGQAEAHQAGKMGAQSTPVSMAAVRIGNIPVYLTALGSVTAFNTVAVKTRVDGQLESVAFQEGQLVQQGQALAEIDPRLYEVQLEQAEGQLAKDQATLDNAKNDLIRYQSLMEHDAVPRQQLDTQAATVKQLDGTIQSDQATISSARLQLQYCHIQAPISGRIGLRLVDAGNMVHAGDPNGLVVITQVQPISVLFTLPEDSLPPVLEKLRTGNHLPVDAYDRSGATKIAAGSLSTVDNQIDQTTGTLRLKAVFENTDNSLFPNQFVNVKLLTDVKTNTLIVPVVAIQRGPQGTFVYVVGADETVSVRPITVGATSATDASVIKGLSAGEKVVTDGMDKLREGSKVMVPGTKPKSDSSDKGGEYKKGGHKTQQ